MTDLRGFTLTLISKLAEEVKDVSSKVTFLALWVTVVAPDADFIPAIAKFVFSETADSSSKSAVSASYRANSLSEYAFRFIQ